MYTLYRSWISGTTQDGCVGGSAVPSLLGCFDIDPGCGGESLNISSQLEDDSRSFLRSPSYTAFAGWDRCACRAENGERMHGSPSSTSTTVMPCRYFVTCLYISRNYIIDMAWEVGWVDQEFHPPHANFTSGWVGCCTRNTAR